MSQNGDGKHVITCPHCQQRFSVSIPKIEMFNDLRSSVLVAAHEKPIRCMNNKCAKRSVVGFQEVEVKWVIIPISEEQAASLDDSAIIPALSLPASLMH